MVIDGKKVAADIMERLRRTRHPEKFLAAVTVGADPSSASFLREKERAARELGADFRLFRFPEDISPVELRENVARIAAMDACGGVLVQLPLPARIGREMVLSGIPQEKDVDNLRGDTAVPAPAVGVVDEILKANNYSLKALRVAVVGAKGFLVGRPVAAWLEGKCARLLTLDMGDDLGALASADIVILGTGSPGLVKPEMLKKGALVIDFGYGKKDGKVCGDFDPSSLTTESSKIRAVSYTPTPGGTGPILVAKLLENFYKLNRK